MMVVVEVRAVRRSPLTGERNRVTNFNTNKKLVRETDESHPPADDTLSLYGGFDLHKQID